MIQMRSGSSESVLREEEVPAKLFVFAQNLTPVAKQLCDGPNVLGNVIYYPNPATHQAALRLNLSADSEPTRLACLYAIIYEAECRWKVQELIACPADPAGRRLLSKALFYPKGQLYIRRTDAFRYRIPDHCFDREGYLINQGEIKDIAFGLRSTHINGCGWVSAYNLLKLNGKELPISEIVRGLSKYGLGELSGENIINLAFFLSRNNLPVRISAGRANITRHMKTASSGILLYSNRFLGSHYAAWKRLDEERCCFYNAVYGRSAYVMTPDAFFDRHVKGLNKLLLYVE